MSDISADMDSDRLSNGNVGGDLQVEPTGRIVHGHEIVARWLGLMPGELRGTSIIDLLDSDGREWLLSCLANDGLGIEERQVRARSGRALRLWAHGKGRFTVIDDSAHAAIVEERTGVACDQARAEFAAAVARELNDPMSIVQGRMELLLELDVSDPAMLRKHLSVALDHARRVSSTLHQLRLVGGPVDGGIEATSARKLLRAASSQVGDVELELDLRPDNLRLLGSADLLEQVLVGLVRRVRDAARNGLLTRAIGYEGQGHAILELRAEPPGHARSSPVPAPGDPRLDVGVSELVLSRIGGTLHALRLGRGVLFRLVLPQAPPLARRRQRRAESAMVVGPGSPTDVCGLLHEEGGDTTCVADAESALRALENARPDGLVATLDLPGMSGLTLLRYALSRWPELRDRAVLVARIEPPGVPDGVRVCRPPVDRAALLYALGVDAGR